MARKNPVGRPVKFNGNLARKIVAAVRRSNASQARKALAEDGISISMPTILKLASVAGLKLHRGRPELAA